MAVSGRTQKLIWGIFAGRCAICRKRLVHDETEGELSLLGEIAHIVGAKENAARGRADLAGGRDDADNLMLVCRDHHKIIDDNETAYPPERLRQIRADYLDWLEDQLAVARRWNVGISQYAYLNVPRLDEFAALAGYEVQHRPVNSKAPLSALGLDLNHLTMAYQRSLDNIAISAIPLQDVQFPHENYIGQLISFERLRFRTRNLPRIRPTSGSTAFTGDPEVDPHIYHQFDDWRLVANIDPQWVTTSTAYGLFRPSSGSSILSGFARINGVNFEEGSMSATALALGLPPGILDSKPERDLKGENDAAADLSAFEDDLTKSRGDSWCGDVNACDFCGRIFNVGDHMVDGPVKRGGPWGNICAKCFLQGDRRLGIGLGQLYLRTREEWALVGGHAEPNDETDE
jgi:hypothetical protein